MKGYVYLMVDNTETPRYKLGITKNDPQLRLKQHQTGSSTEIMILNTYKTVHYKQIERMLKVKYTMFSTCGGTEWYTLTDELALNFISDCKRTESIVKTLENNPFYN